MITRTLVEPSVRRQYERQIEALAQSAIDPEGLTELLALEAQLQNAIDRRIGELHREFSYGELAAGSPVTDQTLSNRVRRGRS